MPGLEMPVRGGGAAMLRELRDEERPAIAGEGHPPLDYDQSYDNMTNIQTDQTDKKQTRKPVSNKTILQSGKQTSKKESKDEDNKANQETTLSVAQIIRQRATQKDDPEVLKTVTLKLSPSLDERIERYCFENKMKKQEFWAEAAALYFETVELPEEQE